MDPDGQYQEPISASPAVADRSVDWLDDAPGTGPVAPDAAAASDDLFDDMFDIGDTPKESSSADADGEIDWLVDLAAGVEDSAVVGQGSSSAAAGTALPDASFDDLWDDMMDDK
ncbi:unnamed protein product [Polarella glacialis]|uniref:Uncharacterized protein n=1 Tax=Polarella glacialis TaxID=89957 RepID=A0A813HBT2_POLGL|nr:unnamed protein product [Polarella glacialis]